MAIRFSPYAVIKMLSFNTILEALNTDSLVDAINSLVNLVNDASALVSKVSTDGRVTEEVFFKSVGLAENVSIDETFNSRPVWGIGEPANPIVIPNNYSANISISRLTLDTLSIRDFTTIPDYWYAPRVQNKVESLLSSTSFGRDIMDYPFYTFLFVSSVEEIKNFTGPLDTLQYLLNRNFYSFMPSDYSQRITSGDAIIITDVRGTGKLLNLRGLIEELSGKIS